MYEKGLKASFISFFCAIYSNPGNPSLWALLSRVVPQYYPRKANVSIYTRAVHTFQSQTQKASLLYHIN